jgi:hypothetical protein
VTDYKTDKDARAVGVMLAERDWNDVVDLELDGCEAAGAKECPARADLFAAAAVARLRRRAIRNVRGGQRNNQDAARRTRDSASSSMSPGSARPPMASGASGRNSIRRRKSRDLSTRTAKGTKPTRR